MSTSYVITNDPNCTPRLYLVTSENPWTQSHWTNRLEDADHYVDIVSAKRAMDLYWGGPSAVVRVDRTETVLEYDEVVNNAHRALEQPEYVGKHREQIETPDKDCRYTWVDGGGYNCRCIEPAGPDGFCDRHRKGCCSTCGGTGAANDPSTNGKCWDCLGTGHAHP